MALKKSQRNELNRLKTELMRLDLDLTANKGETALQLRSALKVYADDVKAALSSGDLQDLDLEAVKGAVEEVKQQVAKFKEAGSAAPAAARAGAAEAASGAVGVATSGVGQSTGPAAPKGVETLAGAGGNKAGTYLYVRGVVPEGDKGVTVLRTVVQGDDLADARSKAESWLKSKGVDIDEAVGSQKTNYRLVDFESAGVQNPIRTLSAGKTLTADQLAQTVEGEYQRVQREGRRLGKEDMGSLETPKETSTYEEARKVDRESRGRKRRGNVGKEAPDDVARASGSAAGDFNPEVREVTQRMERNRGTAQTTLALARKGNPEAWASATKGMSAERIKNVEALMETRLAQGAEGLDPAGKEAFEKLKLQLKEGNFELAMRTANTIPNVEDAVKQQAKKGVKGPRVFNRTWTNPKELTNTSAWKLTEELKAGKAEAQRALRVEYLVRNGALDFEGTSLAKMIDDPAKWSQIKGNPKVLELLDRVARNNDIAMASTNADSWSRSVVQPLHIRLNQFADGRASIKDLEDFEEQFRSRTGQAQPFSKRGDLQKRFVATTAEESRLVRTERNVARARAGEMVAADEGVTSAQLQERLDQARGQLDKATGSEKAKLLSRVNDLERRVKAKTAVEASAKANAQMAATKAGAEGVVAMQPPEPRSLEERLAEVDKEIDNVKKGRGKGGRFVRRDLKGQLGPLEERRNEILKLIEARGKTPASSLPPLGPAFPDEAQVAANRAAIAAEAAPAAAAAATAPAAAPASKTRSPYNKWKPRADRDVELLRKRAARMGIGRAGAGSLGRVGAGALRFLGPLAAVYGAYEIASALKGQTIDEADERRLRVMQALGAVGGGMGQSMMQKEQIRAMQRMTDLAAVQRQAQIDELNKQYTGNMAMDSLIRGNEAALAALATPSRPGVAELMMRY